MIETLRPHRSSSTLLAALVFNLASPAAASAPAGGPFRLLSSDDSGVTLEYEAPEPVLNRVETPFGVFDDITLDDHAGLSVLGRPVLPVRSVGLGIPEGVDVRLSFEVIETRTLPALRPRPAPEGSPQPDAGAVTRAGGVALDDDFYTNGSLWPAAAVEFRELGHLRHHRVGQVVVTPVRWDPRTSQATFLKKARIRLDFETGKGKPAAPVLPVGREDAWEHLYESALLNYEPARRFRTRPVPGLGSPGLNPKSASPARSAGANPEYRLYVGITGLYRVTFADLEAAGWPSDIPVDQIRLFEKAKNDSDLSNPLVTDVPIRIREYDGTAGVFDGEDEFTFHGQNYRDRFSAGGPESRFTYLQVYWLTWDPSGGVRMAEDPGWIEGADFTTPAAFLSTVHHEENRLYISPVPNPNLSYAEAPTWDTAYWVSAVSPRDSLEFNAFDRDETKPFGIRARWQSFFIVGSKITIALSRGTANDDTVLVFRADLPNPAPWTFDTGLQIPGTRLADGRNLFKFNGTRRGDRGQEIAGSGAFFDWFDVSYHRRYVARNDGLEFTAGDATGDVEFAIRGLSRPELVLVDVTDPGSPRWVDLAGASITRLSGPPNAEYELRFRAASSGGKSWILTTDSRLPSYRAAIAPDDRSTPGRLTRDIGPTNLVLDTALDVITDTGAEVIVLTHPDFSAGLAPWIQLRESQGHTIRQVSPQDVYDQFSGGRKSVPAIRDWLRVIYRTWAEPPDYLVLAGDASEDYRRDVLTSDPDWVPTMMFVEPVFGDGRFSLVGQDNYFVRSLGLHDAEQDLLPEMHVGRLPIGTPAETEILVNKLVAYDSYSANDSWRNRGLIVSDDKYSTAINGTEYRYSAQDCGFENGADSVLSAFGNPGCDAGFEIEDLRISDCLNGVPDLGRLDLARGACPSVPDVADLTATKRYVDAHCTPMWVETASRGHLFQLYSGHGNRTVIGTESWVDYFNGRGDADRLTNFGKPFIFFGIACHLNEFEHSEEAVTKHALAEAMLFQPNAGAIASMASTGFELVVTNYWTEVYMAENVFLDPAKDPDTGRPRRVLGEGIDRALVKMAAERGGGIFLNTFRTYGLLGDPTMRIDMAPPRFDVTVNGVPAVGGAGIEAAPGTSRIHVEARMADDVDYREGSFTILDGDSTVSPEHYSLTPYEGSGDAACRGVRLVYEPELRPDTYAIDFKLGDWLNRDAVFRLNVILDVQYRLDGRPIGELDFVPLNAPIEVAVESPVDLTEADIDVRVNGETGYFDLEPGTDARSWTARLDRGLPSGRVDIATRIRGGESRSITLTAGDDLNFSDVYFYPNPWDGKSPARFTYQLVYREGERPQNVSVSVYTVSGRRVASIDGPVDGGRTWLDWNGKDGEGDDLANGVYLYKLTIDLADGKKLSRIDRLVVHR